MLERVDTRHRWLDILPALGVPSRAMEGTISRFNRAVCDVLPR
jgi:hypothetical protein